MASNLPPGITDSMIPGNRAEDTHFDWLAEKLGNIVRDALTDDNFAVLVEWVAEHEQVVYEQGFRDGHLNVEQD